MGLQKGGRFRMVISNCPDPSSAFGWTKLLCCGKKANFNVSFKEQFNVEHVF
jgi:hypothetical protein